MDERFIEVSNLLARYCWLVDAWQFDEWAKSCFTADGVFEVGGQALQGPKAIAAYVGGAIGGYRLIRHLVYHPEIAFTAEGAARVRCYFTLVGVDGAGQDIQAQGRYDDEIVLTDDGWRFRRRVAAFDFYAPRADAWAKGAGARREA